jgi:hypothetical protein
MTGVASNMKLCLSIGPTTRDRFTEAQLRRGWQVYGGELLRQELPLSPGRRPWGWWRFVAGESGRRLAATRPSAWLSSGSCVTMS